MATEDDAAVKKGKPDKGKKPEVNKRELKSTKRKGGVPALKKTKKRRNKILLGVFVVFALLASVFFLPRVGTVRYGICKAFVELHDPYPAFLEFVQASESGYLVIIDYNRIDSFGQRSLNQIRCNFKTDPNFDAELAKVDINGKTNILPQEAPEVVNSFNKGVISLIKNKPDLDMPVGLPQDVKEYR